MKHAIRNSLILFGILVLLYAGGWAYLHYIIEPKIQAVKETKTTREQELAEINNTISRYGDMKLKLSEIQQRYTKFPKDLFPAPEQSVIYGFINALSTGRAYIDYNLKYVNTEYHDGYGIVKTSLVGNGYFHNLFRFISAIEGSRPLTKITALSVTSIDETGSLGKVDIRMEIKSYFYHQKSDKSDSQRWIKTASSTVWDGQNSENPPVDVLKRGLPIAAVASDGDWTKVSTNNSTGWVQSENLTSNPGDIPYPSSRVASSTGYNPFYPHIHTVPKNQENLVDVSKSSLLGLTAETAYLIDQNNQMRQISRGDEVYLGYFASINQKEQTATFRLNKGGIRERVTLQVDQKSN
ncbi:MAG: hypothetical protein K9N46_07485 [Candidatus Marinimicrobia bacterium]|nr:hypothetical protein [Candidatus Neomarinimicrobiota bacterium]MCF7880565.1 hypothetical protein [Candidatus Neomarinimicrobiota bacterium]